MPCLLISKRWHYGSTFRVHMGKSFRHFIKYFIKVIINKICIKYYPQFCEILCVQNNAYKNWIGWRQERVDRNSRRNNQKTKCAELPEQDLRDNCCSTRNDISVPLQAVCLLPSEVQANARHEFFNWIFSRCAVRHYETKMFLNCVEFSLQMS